MKALLISPSTLRDKDPFGAFTRASRYPYGLYVISAMLEAHGVQASILDLEVNDLGIEEVMERERPDVVGITAVTPTRFEAIETVRKVRKLSPGSLIVVGGPHFTFTADDALRHVPEIDVVVRGEGEYTMLELVQSLNEGAFRKDIAGISYCDNGEIIHNPDRPPIKDLDALPTIDYERIPLDKYKFIFLGVPCVSIITSRGCPINCVFCSTAEMWGKCPRWRSPSKVVDEIEYVLKNLDGIEGIYFDDDTFNLSRKHILGVCEEIEKRGLEFRWCCNVRVDTVDRALLERIKRAGCTLIAFGVESGSPRVLDLIGKRITREQVMRTLKDAKELGMKVRACFMYSLPWEKEEDRRLTFEFIEDLIEAGIDYFNVRPTTIYPGTAVEARALELGILPADFSWSEPYYNEKNKIVSELLANTPLYTEDLTLDGIVETQIRHKGRRHALWVYRPLMGKAGVTYALRQAGIYLWGFKKVRSFGDLRKRLVLGRQVIKGLAKGGAAKHDL